MKMSHLFCIAFLAILLASCQFGQPTFSDISYRVKANTIVPTEKGDYFYPVWLSNGIVTFLTFPVGDNYALNPPDLPDLHYYEVEHNTWNKIAVKPDTNCRRIIFDFMQRLPDQRLGFVERCLPYDANDDTRTIREMDIKSGESKVLIEPSWDIRQIGPFSYSTDMSELIEEDMAGHNLSNKLFYRKGDTITQIAPNFIRAMHPAWSPHKRQIAFLGTADYPGKKPGEFKTLSDIGELALYPWDLYTSTPEGGDLKKLLSSVQGPLIIKWSPKENILAFSGTVENLPGIWLIDTTTSKLTRIWRVMGDFDFFDWSPDGKKIVVVNSDLDENFKVTAQKINIIDLP